MHIKSYIWTGAGQRGGEHLRGVGEDLRQGQASGLVNAVLRKIAQNKTALPPIPERDEAKYLSIRYSHPKWLVKRLLSILGREEAEAFLAANNDTPPVTVQVNPLKTNAESLIKELEGWGVTAKPHPWVPGCLELTGPGSHHAGSLPGG